MNEETTVHIEIFEDKKKTGEAAARKAAELLKKAIAENKRATFIAAEIYGQIEPGTTFEEWMGKAPPDKIIPELSVSQIEAIRAGKLVLDPKTGRIATPESLIKKEPETPAGFLLGTPDFTTPLYFK